MVSFHFSELSFPVSRFLVLLTGFTAHSAASHDTRIQTQNHDRISHTFTLRHTLKLHVYLLEFLFEEQQPLLLHACTVKAFYSGACLSDRKERIVLLQSGRQKDVLGGGYAKHTRRPAACESNVRFMHPECFRTGASYRATPVHAHASNVKKDYPKLRHATAGKLFRRESISRRLSRDRSSSRYTQVSN